MAGNPPDYDNVRWGGPKGVRIPQEVFPATMMIKKEVDINLTGVVTTLNLDPSQQMASYYTFKSAAGAINVTWPVVVPGLVFAVSNQSGQALTFIVKGATGIVVASTKRALLAMDNSLTTPDVVRLGPDT